MRVYLDHAATTPVDPRVLHAMLPFFTERAGNASSVHGFGQDARAAVDQARAQVAATIGARPSEVVFTSGATESDNLAVFGVALAAEARGRHIVTTAIEHHAVLEACHLLEQRGWTVTYVPVDGRGIVDPDDVRRSLRPDTVLVSVMAANNEIGTLQPVTEIGRFTRERNIPFHTDATQLVGAAPVGVDDLHVDLLSMSAHKRYGPKGVGALFVRTGTRVASVQRGGSHERGLRGGTENVPGIVGLGAALRIALEVMEDEQARLTALRDRLIRETLEMPGPTSMGIPRAGCPTTSTCRSTRRTASRSCWGSTSTGWHPVPGRRVPRAAWNRPTCSWRWGFPRSAPRRPSGSPSAAGRPTPRSPTPSERSATWWRGSGARPDCPPVRRSGALAASRGLDLGAAD